jgi:hypothetical protein
MGSSPWVIDPSTGVEVLNTAANQAAIAKEPASAATAVNYNQLLPSASQLESFTPLPYQSFGSVPYTQAATVNPANVAATPNAQAASVDLSSMPGLLSQYEGDVKSAMAPTFAQQNDQLNASLAGRGIYNSTAGQQLSNNLQGQQDAALAGAYEPLIQQMQTDYTKGQEQNSAQQQATNLVNYTGSQDRNALLAELQQQAGLANQDATNVSNTNNANMYNNTVTGNATEYNNNLQRLYNDQNSLSTGLMSDILQTYDPGLYNNLLTQGASSAGTAYGNAYTAGAGNSSNLSSALGTLGGSLFPGKSATSGAGVPDMSNSSFGDY